MEASTITHSESTSRNFDSVTAKYESSVIFPMYDYITQDINLPNVIYIIVLLYVGFQIILSSLWLPAEKVWLSLSNTEAGNSLIEYFHAIFGACPKTFYYPIETLALIQNDTTASNSTINSAEVFSSIDNDLLFTFVAYTIIVVFSFILIVSQILIYLFQRRFQRSVMTLTRFVLEDVIFIIMIPLALLTGKCFHRMVDDDSPSRNYVFFAFTFIYYLVCLPFFYLSFSFIIKSVYLPLSPFASFKRNAIVLITIIPSFFILLQNALSIFPNWVFYFLIPLHFIFFLYLAFIYIQRPFLKPFACIWLFAVILSCLLNDIISFILLFIDIGINGLYIMIFEIALTFLSILSSHLIPYLIFSSKFNHVPFNFR